MSQRSGNNHLGPGAINLAYVEGLYEEFLRDPAAVSADWQEFFRSYADREFRFPKPRFGPSFKPRSLFNPPVPTAPSDRLVQPEAAALQDRVRLE